MDAIGIGALGSAPFLVDAAGEPVTDALLFSLDARAAAERDELGLTDDHALPKVRWLAARHPDAVRATDAGGWIAEQLTGRPTMDSITRLAWTPELGSAAADSRPGRPAVPRAARHRRARAAARHAGGRRHVRLVRRRVRGRLPGPGRRLRAARLDHDRLRRHRRRGRRRRARAAGVSGRGLPPGRLHLVRRQRGRVGAPHLRRRDRARALRRRPARAPLPGRRAHPRARRHGDGRRPRDHADDDAGRAAPGVRRRDRAGRARPRRPDRDRGRRRSLARLGRRRPQPRPGCRRRPTRSPRRSSWPRSRARVPARRCSRWRQWAPTRPRTAPAGSRPTPPPLAGTATRSLPTVPATPTCEEHHDRRHRHRRLERHRPRLRRPCSARGTTCSARRGPDPGARSPPTWRPRRAAAP